MMEKPGWKAWRLSFGPNSAGGLWDVLFPLWASSCWSHLLHRVQGPAGPLRSNARVIPEQ